MSTTSGRTLLHKLIGGDAYQRSARLYHSLAEPWRRFAWRYGRFGSQHRHALQSLRNRHRGQRCFVICNGPSLRNTPVQLLRDEITLGSNALFLLFEESGFRPTYYTIEDKMVAEDRYREANAITGCFKIYPSDLAHLLSINSDGAYTRFRRDYAGFPKFSDDISDFSYWGGTVTMLNLQIAHHLGCNPVYIIGCDHSYTIPVGHNADRFGRITSQVDDPNHFHPGYFGPGYRWHDPKVERMEAGYRVARQAFEKDGRTVYNATAGGKLEVFPRWDFHALFSSNV